MLALYLVYSLLCYRFADNPKVIHKKLFRRFKAGESVPTWLLEPSFPCEIKFIKDADIYHAGKDGYYVYPVEKIQKGEALVKCIILTEQEGDINGKGNCWSGVPYSAGGTGEGFIFTITRPEGYYQNIKIGVEP